MQGVPGVPKEDEGVPLPKHDADEADCGVGGDPSDVVSAPWCEMGEMEMCRVLPLPTLLTGLTRPVTRLSPPPALVVNEGILSTGGKLSPPALLLVATSGTFSVLTIELCVGDNSEEDGEDSEL